MTQLCPARHLLSHHPEGEWDGYCGYSPDCPTCQRETEPNRFQRDIDYWNETGKCLRHFSIDTPPRFCEQCGKSWKAVMDGRDGRKRRRERAA